MADVTVSVIIPSFNHAKYIGAAIESVIAQSFQDWELLVIDDQSSDESVEVARSFKDPRITVGVNDQNLGTYETENRGLELAKGSLIAILNSDDYWHPAKIERQVDVLSRHPEIQFCYARGGLANEVGEVIDLDSHHGRWPTDEVHDILPFELLENRVLASSLVFRAGAIRFDGSLRYSGDWVAMLELSRRGLAGFVGEPSTFWRLHAGQAHRVSPGVVAEEIRIRRAILGDPNLWNAPHSDPRKIELGLARCALALNAVCHLAGDRRGASEALRLARRYDPSNPTLRKRRLAPFLPWSFVARRLWPNVPDPEVIRGQLNAEKLRPFRFREGGSQT